MIDAERALHHERWMLDRAVTDVDGWDEITEKILIPEPSEPSIVVDRDQLRELDKVRARRRRATRCDDFENVLPSVRRSR